MKALEIIRDLNEQRKGNISKAFNQTSPDKYFEKLSEKEINKSEAFETIQKAFEEGKISNEEFEKAMKAGHKYIRKEGDRYIYKEGELKKKMTDVDSEDKKVDSILSKIQSIKKIEDLENMKSQIFSSSSNWNQDNKNKLGKAIKERIEKLK